MFVCPSIPDNIVHAWYKFYAYINPNYLLPDWSRARIIQEIVSLGYPAFSGSCGQIYLEKCFVSSNISPMQDLLMLAIWRIQVDVACSSYNI